MGTWPALGTWPAPGYSSGRGRLRMRSSSGAAGCLGRAVMRGLLAFLLSTPAGASAPPPIHVAASATRRVSGWTSFTSCGEVLCPNMTRQIAQIVRHADVLDTVMPYTGGAAPQYDTVTHSACYYNGTQRLATIGTWAGFRFGGPADSPTPGGGQMPVHICAPCALPSATPLYGIIGTQRPHKLCTDNVANGVAEQIPGQSGVSVGGAAAGSGSG
jgi:hypothetical protein